MARYTSATSVKISLESWRVEESGGDYLPLVSLQKCDHALIFFKAREVKSFQGVLNFWMITMWALWPHPPR